MWTCSSCGATNEPHMIFCSSCGAMRNKAPARAPRSPLPDEPLPAPSGPRFRGTATAFRIRWIGMSLGGALLAWVLQSVLFAAAAGAVYRSHGAFSYRVVNVLISIFAYGGALGLFQGMALSRTLEAPRIRWLEATFAGYFLGGIATLLQPEHSWQNRSLENILLFSGLFGALGGALRGLFQAQALRKLGPARWMVFWPLVSIVITALGSVLSMAAWHLTTQRMGTARFQLAAGLVHVLVGALVTTIPLGFVLGSCLSRQLGENDDEPIE